MKAPAVDLLKLNTLRGTNPLFQPLKGMTVLFLSAQHLKATAKVPAGDCLRLTTLRGTKPAFPTPKKYDKHPGLFLW